MSAGSQLFAPYPTAGTAELSEVLTVIRNMILSPAMTAQIAVAAARLSAGAVPVNVTDSSTGLQFYAGDLSENDGVGTTFDNSWLDPQIQNCVIAERVKLTPPFPSIELVGRQGRMAQGAVAGINLEELWGTAYWYRVDAVAWASGSREQLLQRKAMIYAECVMRMLRRDPTLGGLVRLIRSVGPVQAAGGGVPNKESGLVMAATARFEALVIQP